MKNELTDEQIEQHWLKDCLMRDKQPAWLVFARAVIAADRAQRQESDAWSCYVASMVEAYLQSEPSADKREAAIAGIIGRRLWALSSEPDRAQRQAEPYAWCVAATNSADWAFAATQDGVKENALFLDADCSQTDPFPLYTAAPQSAVVPAGYKLVPLEPTPKMIDATFNDSEELSRQPESHNKRNRRIYLAMLAAAPDTAMAKDAAS